MYSTKQNRWGDWYVCKDGKPTERYASELEAEERIKRLHKAKSLQEPPQKALQKAQAKAPEPKKSRGRPRKVAP